MPAGLEAADERIRERAVGLDGELAGQIGLVVGGDSQHVLRADDVVVDRDGRRGRLRLGLGKQRGPERHNAERGGHRRDQMRAQVIPSSHKSPMCQSAGRHMCAVRRPSSAVVCPR